MKNKFLLAIWVAVNLPSEEPSPLLKTFLSSTSMSISLSVKKCSVPDIFKNKGEIYFRKKEALYLQEVLQKEEDMVLSLGGGTPCFGNNMQLIQAAGAVSIYLKYQPQTLTQRLLQQKDHRPLLAEIKEIDLEEFIRKHLFDRNPYYAQATHIIAMDGLTHDQSLQKLLTVF